MLDFGYKIFFTENTQMRTEYVPLSDCKFCHRFDSQELQYYSQPSQNVTSRVITTSN